VRQTFQGLWDRYFAHENGGGSEQPGGEASQTDHVSVSPQTPFSTPMSSFVRLDDVAEEDETSSAAPD